MANQLVHVTDFPYESVVFEQYLLVSDGKKMASVVEGIEDSVEGIAYTEVRLGSEEPYYCDSVEEALADVETRFSPITKKTKLTFGQAKAARLIG